MARFHESTLSQLPHNFSPLRYLFYRILFRPHYVLCHLPHIIVGLILHKFNNPYVYILQKKSNEETSEWGFRSPAI